ncbi:hypothetical protein [Pedobacter lusitanus]|uniref:hypothetical protein n=1 Tax=Pedobacter lusitanus TaxID=1503925 RepID=UPI0032AEEBEE
MKKALLTLAIIGTAYASSYAQTNIFESGSNVGIGTHNPTGKLEIVGPYNGEQLVISRDVLAGAEGPGIIFKNIINNGTLQKISGIESQLMSGGVGAVSGSLNLYTVNNSNKINALSITPGGNVGVGTTTPSGALEISGQSNGDQLIISRNVLAGGEGPGITFKNIINNSTIEKIGGIESQLKSGGVGAVSGSLNLFTLNNSVKVDAISVAPNGDVGIGTADTRGYKLAINGNIRSKEIMVETSNWPDYVFESDYPLISLTELKNYIDHNKHLPDLPSAQEVTKNGINLGEIVKVQTKKIEELTLHLIEKDKQFDSLRRDNQSQQAQINELKDQLSKLLSKQ